MILYDQKNPHRHAGCFLLLFLWLFLQTESKGADDLGYPVKIFLDADPLIFITTILSSRAWYDSFFLAIFVLVATVVLGRVFCGWICPWERSTIWWVRCKRGGHRERH